MMLAADRLEPLGPRCCRQHAHKHPTATSEGKSLQHARALPLPFEGVHGSGLTAKEEVASKPPEGLMCNDSAISLDFVPVIVMVGVAVHSVVVVGVENPITLIHLTQHATCCQWWHLRGGVCLAGISACHR